MRNRELEEIAAFGEAPGSTIDPDFGGMVRGMIEVRSRALGEIASLGQDRDLSDVGRRNRKRALANKALQELEQIKFGSLRNYQHAIEATRERIQTLQARIDAKEAALAESPAAAVRQVALWGLLAQLDPLERPAAFLTAIEHGDADTYYAFARAPRFLNLLPSQELEKGRLRWNLGRNPEAAQEIVTYQRALAEVENVREQVVREISNAGELADPIAAAASEG